MNFIFSIMMFSIALNLGVGIMNVAMEDMNPEYSGGLEYDPNYVNDFVNQKDQNLTPAAVSGGSVGTDESRLFDRLGLGKIIQFVKVIPKYTFGFVNLLQNLLGKMMSPALESIVFNGLKTLMTIGYILGLFWLITGKNLSGGK